MEPHEAAAASQRWVIELMRRCGIRVERFGDGTLGLIDVPAKYVAAIDTMHTALFEVLQGGGLPEFLPEEPKPPKRARKVQR